MYTLALLFFVSFFSSIVFGALENHFKSAEDKSDMHRMKNIDFIYVINLDQRPEKFLDVINQLEPFNVYPYRFSAVNGWELSLEAINDVGVQYSEDMRGGFLGTSYLDSTFFPNHGKIQKKGQTYFCHCMSRGAIGIVLSHLSVLQDAYDAGYETIWVMEDDIELKRDPNVLSDLIEKMDSQIGYVKWDVLFTDRDTRNTNGKYVSCNTYASRPNFVPKNPSRFGKTFSLGPDFRKVSARYGAYSYIIRRSGIEKLLKFFKNYHVFLPYDIDYFAVDDIQLYTVQKDVVAHKVKGIISDNGGPNYLNKK